MKIDETDMRILNFLQKNSNQTAKELSVKLSLSNTPIYERIKKLENNGIIKGYVALLDPSKVNKEVLVLVNITIKDHSKKYRTKLVQSLLELNEIMELYNTSGSYDFIAKARFKDISEYKEFLVNKLASIENIQDIDTQIVLEELKYSTEINITSPF